MAAQREAITFSIDLHHKRSTKGTYVFECDERISDSASITALYIRKSAFANYVPAGKIRVTIQEVGDN